MKYLQAALHSIVLVALISAWPAHAQSGQNVQAELNALVAAAKAEGEVVFYCSPAENACW